MSESTYSFVYDRAAADAAVHGVAPRELTLSILAGILTGPDSEGCLVYRGASPLGAATVCIGTRGRSADEIQLRLLEGFERLAVTIIEVYEGGPEVIEAIATARNGRWTAP